MKLLFRILAPLCIVAAAVWGAQYLISTKPEPRTFDPPAQATRVEATRIRAEDYQVFLDTQGTVRPRTSSVLVPEVSGRVVEVSPNFREGAFFEKEEVLLTIDPLRYETALVVARSAEAQALRSLEEERVKAAQAVANWKLLGKKGEPGDLAARKPQLAEAEARYQAAQAEVVQAERDLERTVIKAPFNGRIVEQIVDVGQFVTSNTELGRAFATDVMEVRLPLTNRQLSHVDLPDGNRESGKSTRGSNLRPDRTGSRELARSYCQGRQCHRRGVSTALRGRGSGRSLPSQGGAEVFPSQDWDVCRRGREGGTPRECLCVASQGGAGRRRSDRLSTKRTRSAGAKWSRSGQRTKRS